VTRALVAETGIAVAAGPGAVQTSSRKAAKQRCRQTADLPGSGGEVGRRRTGDGKGWKEVALTGRSRVFVAVNQGSLPNLCEEMKAERP
jgi:hypothetical protein